MTDITNFIKHWIKNRTVKFMHANKSPTLKILNKGVPQGSVLSPLLFNYYTKNLVQNLPAQVQLLQFADDSILVSGDATNLNLRKFYLYRAFTQIYNNLRKLGLELSVIKTKYICFHNKCPENNCSLCKDQMVLMGDPKKNEIKTRFLGLILDQNLNYKHHITFIRDKCFKLLNILRYLRTTWWGGNPLVLLNLYKSLIRSTLEYGLMNIYKSNTFHYLNQIEVIQNEGIRLAFGYRRTTPINVILTESKMLYIKYRVQSLTNTYITKLFINNKTNVTQFLDQYRLCYERYNFNRPNTYMTLLLTTYKNIYKYKNLIYALPATPSPEDSHLYRTIDCSSGKNIKDNIDMEIFLDHQKRYRCRDDNLTSIYTDGSLIKGHPSTGAAVYSPELRIERKFALDNCCSIFTAENYALLMALKLITESQKLNFLIFTDSLSSLQACLGLVTNKEANPYNLELRDTIQTTSENLVRRGGSLKIVWIRAHIGIAGNERVDNLAREATSQPFQNNIKIPRADLVNKLLNDIKNQQEAQLTTGVNTYKGNHYFNNYHNNSKQIWFSKFKDASKSLIVNINRIRANHYNLPESLFRKNLYDSPECIHCCGDDEEDVDAQAIGDINHLFWNCPAFNLQRNNLFENLRRHEIRLDNPTCESLIKLDNFEVYKIIIQFLNDININV